VRFEWYQLQCGSGSIGRVVVDCNHCQFLIQKIVGAEQTSGSGTTSGSGQVAMGSFERGDPCSSNGA
jgi:hypothetical protein